MEMFTRNWAFISPEQQQRLAECKVAVAGCGMSSVAADLLARTGFQNFALADGDVFDVSNLNRQLCTRKDLGRNKAEVTGQRILDINPDAQIVVTPEFIVGEDMIRQFLTGADIAINAIDLNEDFLTFNRVAAENGVPVVFPLNIGWGIRVLVFMPDSPSLEEMLNVQAEQLSQVALLSWIAAQGKLPDYLLPLLPRLQDMDDASVWPCDPQLGVAVYNNASFLTTIMAKLAWGQTVHTVPTVITHDPFTQVSPAE